MQYEVSKGVTGHTVRYDCPNCGSKLVNPLGNAGAEDYCPDCHQPHVVPGTAEREMAARQRVETQTLLNAARDKRKAESKEAVVNRVAKKAKREQKLQLDRDPLREWFLYAGVLTAVLGLAAGRHFFLAITTDVSGLCLVIVALFSLGVALNYQGVRGLRSEYVCAAECLKTMRRPNGIRELLTLPAAGVLHQHIKDLAAIAQYDQSVSQDGLVALMYSRMMARCRIVDVLSGMLVSLGLIGTVIGLISMTDGLRTTLDSLDRSDGSDQLLSGMRATMSGLGTAFYTTLVGAFLGSVALRLLNNVYTSNVDRLVSYVASLTEVRIVPILRSRPRAPSNAEDPKR